MIASILTEDFPKNQAEFDKRFNNEQSCRDYLYAIRWPDGFKCSRCGSHRFWESNRGLLICKACEHQHSLTAGTILHGTRKPLVMWFRAMWWFTTRKTGVNAINLMQLLGLGSYNTAWLWLQKLRSCTVCQSRRPLSGKVESDEFYLGGRKSGKRGRGADHKCAVAIAVERNLDKKLGRLRLQVIEDCSAGQLIPFLKNNVVQKSNMTTDGWPGYLTLNNIGFKHDRIIQSEMKAKKTVMSGVHLVTSLIKRIMNGTFQGRFEKKYLQRYLDEYVFRFNRRNCIHVGKKFYRIIQQVAVTPAIDRKQVMIGIPVPALAN